MEDSNTSTEFSFLRISNGTNVVGQLKKETVAVDFYGNDETTFQIELLWKWNDDLKLWQNLNM